MYPNLVPLLHSKITRNKGQCISSGGYGNTTGLGTQQWIGTLLQAI